MTNKLLNEKYIKTLLIDYLRTIIEKDFIIASEVPYIYGKRRVDILVVSKDSLYAFEIKSDKDDLNKLASQVTDYNKTFNYTNIVFSSKFGTKDFKSISRSVGLIQIFDNNTKLIRKAKKRIRLNKRCLSYFLWRKDIVYMLNKHTKELLAKKTETEKLRKLLLSKVNANIIMKSAIYALKKRYEEKYNNFISSVGDKTTVADLDILTSSIDF